MRLPVAVIAVLLGGGGAGLIGIAGSQAGEVVVLPTEPSGMVFVGAGEFSMGMSANEKEMGFFHKLCLLDFRRLAVHVCTHEVTTMASRGARDVDLGSFFIDRHEVLVRDYRLCVQAGKCSVDPLLVGDQRYHKNEWPIANVTWPEARDYCGWKGARLPTEAEWEKAARGPQSLRFPWGNQWSADSANHGQFSFEAEIGLLEIFPRLGDEYDLFWAPNHASDGRDGHPYASEPGSQVWGASPYGAADMAGNVSEWVADYYSLAGYVGLAATNPLRSAPVGAERRRVVRGGSWMTPRLLMLAYLREAAEPETRSSTRGFRCAKDR